MKKALVYILSAVLAVALAASIGGCAVPSGGSSKIQIVTTIFPLYDWVRSVAGDSENVEITLLLDNGVDLHSFQPKAADIVKVSKCDMLSVELYGQREETLCTCEVRGRGRRGWRLPLPCRR